MRVPSEHAAADMNVQTAASPSQPTRTGPLRKRVRDAGEVAAGATEPFHILPVRSSSVQKPFRVWPLHLLPRANLPLYFLNHQHKKHGSEPSGLFRTHAPALQELDVRHEGGAAPQLLIASVDRLIPLFAVERVDQHLYSISKLSGCITRDHIAALVSANVPAIAPATATLPAAPSAEQWWAHAAIERPLKKPRLEGDGSRRTDQGAPAPAIASSAVQVPVEPPPFSDVEHAPTEELDDAQQNSADAISSLIMQYLEALYLSKASHAYFAKAPIARARAAFHHGATDGDQSPSLAGALRDLILPIPSLDKKYRTKVPETVKAMSLASPEPAKSTSRKRAAKPKKLKKLKPNKEGMYSLEDDFLQKWWGEQEDTHTTAVATSSQINLSIQALRTRETLLQLVLILEVLALEKHVQRSKKSGFHSTTDSTDHVNESGLGGSKPSKKPQDLDVLLDVLVDRLCIQQSIELGASKDDFENQDSQRQSEDAEDVPPGGKRDRMMDFCLAVVVPFYGPRLPRLVESLSGRFGVRASRSPEKIRSNKTKEKSAPAPKPGTEIKRPPPDQPKKHPLQRVLSDSRKERPSKPPPSLQRSVTDTRINQPVERSRSSTPQMPTFRGDGRRSLSRAGSISQVAQPLQREVDLSAMARRFGASKPNRKPNVDQELKDAIATLKKPNRNMAVREYVDAADQRKTMPKTRPGSKPQGVTGIARSKSHLGVQVDATPRRSLKHSFDQGLVEPLRLLESPETLRNAEIEAVVASSSVKPAEGCMLSDSTGPFASRRGGLAQHDQTPTRARLRTSIATTDEDSDDDMDGFVPPSLERGQVSSTPFKVPFPKMTPLRQPLSQSPLLSQVASRQDHASRIERNSSILDEVPTTIEATPPKSKSEPNGEQHKNGSMTAAGPRPAMEDGKSIYDMLGWNDDEDELI